MQPIDIWVTHPAQHVLIWASVSGLLFINLTIWVPRNLYCISFKESNSVNGGTAVLANLPRASMTISVCYKQAINCSSITMISLRSGLYPWTALFGNHKARDIIASRPLSIPMISCLDRKTACDKESSF